MPPWITPRDIGFMRGALTKIIAGWADTVLWLRHIDAETPGATPTVGYDLDRQQVASQLDGSFGRGWQATDRRGIVRLGYLAAVPLVAGVWNPGTLEVVTPEGLSLYSGAVLVYQCALPVANYDVIVDPLDTALAGAAQRYAVGDQLADVQAFGTSIYRYAALEPRAPSDGIYQIPLC